MYQNEENYKPYTAADDPLGVNDPLFRRKLRRGRGRYSYQARIERAYQLWYALRSVALSGSTENCLDLKVWCEHLGWSARDTALALADVVRLGLGYRSADGSNAITLLPAPFWRAA